MAIVRPTLQEVPVAAVPLDRFAPIIGEEAMDRVRAASARMRRVLEGRTVWNVNSTSSGGGVAEMLHRLLAYGRGAGVDTRWIVIEGDPEFFRITKRLHNRLHGSTGDGGALGAAEHDHFRAVGSANAEELLNVVEPGDVVILHDPQTVALIPHVMNHGAVTVWRSHIGTDVDNEHVHEAWEFLQPDVAGCDAFVFTLPDYVPDFVDRDRVRIIEPSLDPFAAKNEDISADQVAAIVGRIGVVNYGSDTAAPVFMRQDGSPGRVNRRADILRAGPGPAPDTPLVVQVSRWDGLKDMIGVMRGFADFPGDMAGAHLALVGPNVTGVADDPEGAEVLAECMDEWWRLPNSMRARVQLVCLPMDDLEENAMMVNAIQRHAAVVVQKSLAEGFGLTVAEAMWKGRPVVAGAVGGIRQQVVDGQTGVLLDDPSDLSAFGEALESLLSDPDRMARMGDAAKERAIERFLSNRHLLDYASLLEELVSRNR